MHIFPEYKHFQAYINMIQNFLIKMKEQVAMLDCRAFLNFNMSSSEPRGRCIFT